MAMAGKQFPWWGALITVIAVFICFVIWLRFRGAYDNTDNIRSIVAQRLALVKPQGVMAGFNNYLLTEDLPDTAAILSNFHFSTVHVAGCFFPVDGSPAGSQYVFSPDALRVACQGGARAFVLDIWASQEAAGRFRPILQVVDAGSKWRRISMNTMEFGTALETIVNQIYSVGLGDTDKSSRDDLVVLYLRFQGVPRNETYAAVATALTRHAAPYLLEPSFSYCRGAERLIRTNVRELKGKIIIVSNMTKQDMERYAAPVFPYVNMCPRDSIRVEYTPAEVAVTEEDILPAIRSNIPHTLTFVVPDPLATETHTNDWSWALAYQRGIHCIPMNIFMQTNNDKSAAYFNKDTGIFGKYSYKLKAPENRLVLTVVPEANRGTDPGTGDATLNVPHSPTVPGI